MRIIASLAAELSRVRNLNGGRGTPGQEGYQIITDGIHRHGNFLASASANRGDCADDPGGIASSAPEAQSEVFIEIKSAPGASE